MTTKVTGSVLSDTGVTAGNYGAGAVNVVLGVDAQGRVTSAANVTATVANTNITGLITNPQIASVANTKITGLITSPQIASVANTQITGLITAPQIAPSAIPAGGFANMQVF
ncbi:MAG: hypothetical protein EBU90_29285, partial [Proteobacteria bacterium]|nr:hypothetical protein [Pseudomonadota bacterium]